MIIFITSNVIAQAQTVADTAAVHSIEGIVKEVLHIISGTEGKQRDWESFRNLFLPTADFTILNHDDSFPQPVETVSLEEFISSIQDDYYEQGYLEYAIGKVVNEYNGIAQVFQSFYAKDSENQETRGITSYQLVYFSDRWWIANLVWTTDTNGVKVPKKYLKH